VKLKKNLFGKGGLPNYLFNKKFRIEGGFLNQILQLPREIMLPGSPNGRNVFQYSRFRGV